MNLRKADVQIWMGNKRVAKFYCSNMQKEVLKIKSVKI